MPWGRTLLEEGFFYEEGLVGSLQGTLHPLEVGEAMGFRGPRLMDYTAGRTLARRMLEGMGLPAGPLLSGRGGVPVWPGASDPGTGPADLIVSISHSTGLCGVLLAPRGRYLSVALDIERTGRVTRAVTQRICGAGEMGLIDGSEDPALAATLVFAAKECMYKLQYPLTGRGIGLGQAECVGMGPGWLRVRVAAPPPVRSPLYEGMQVGARWVMSGGYVRCVMAIGDGSAPWASDAATGAIF